MHSAQPLSLDLQSVSVMSRKDRISGLFSRSFSRPSELLCCVFGLNKNEIDTYFVLLTGEKTVEEVAEVIDRDRTTVQRVLTSLYKKGLARRETKYFPRGGHYFVYSAVSPEQVREVILRQLDQFYQTTKRFLSDSWTALIQ